MVSQTPIPILHVNHVAYISGAEVSLLTLLRSLSAQRYHLVLACPPHGALPDRARALGIDVEAIAPLRLHRRMLPTKALLIGWRLMWNLVQLIRVIKRRRIRVIHANSLIAAIIAIPAARLCRIPAIWHIRDLALPGRLVTWLGRSADRIVVPARHLKELAVARGLPPEKIRVIPNGVDIEVFRKAALTHSPHGAPLIGMVAQLVPWKRHADFLRAAALIRRSVPTARCLIVGADLFAEHAAYCRQLRRLSTQLGLDDCLAWLGYQHTIAPIMAMLDVLILPSCREPFGRVIVEAQAAGVVSVAVAAAGPAEIIESGRTGLLVACGDYQALADATCSLLRDDAMRRRMARAGQAHAEHYFATQITTEQFADCVSQLLSDDLRSD